MLLNLIFVIFSLIATTKAQQFNNCGVSGKPTGLIVNGSQSKKGTWPWLVAIYKIDGNKFICGGTLVSSNIIITAAHCIIDKTQEVARRPGDLVVKLGRYDLSQQYERGAIDAYPSEIIVHTDWKTLSLDYDADIAIIKLTSPVTFNDLIYPICLPSESFDKQLGGGYVAGWGKSESDAIHENITRELNISIIGNEDCFFKNSRFAEISSRNTFCAGKDGDAGVCNGDSGGGLFILHQSRWFLKGIVSASFLSLGRCDTSQFAVFTNVPKFLAWINRIMMQTSAVDRLQPPPSSSKNGIRKEIVCYIANWAMYRPIEGAFTLDNFKPELCTTAIYHFAGLDEFGALKSLDPYADLENDGGKNGFKKLTGLKKSHSNLKRVLLSVGGWNEGGSKFSKVAALSFKRKSFAYQSVDFLKRYSFDGLNIYWDWPADKDRGGLPDDKENFVQLLADISDLYRHENLYLSMTVRSVKWIVEKAYDIQNLSKHVDAINVMTFDYAGPWDKKIGFNAPLHSSQVDVKSSIELFVNAGAPIEKLILGIPFYGRSFVAANIEQSAIGDASEGDGFAGPFIQDKTFFGYNEFCKMKNEKRWSFQFNTGASQMVGKFIENGKMNVATFETPRSVANKVKFAMENGLLGVWAWSIDTDDFNGVCEVDETTYSDFGIKKPALSSVRDFPLLRTINDVINFMEN